LLDGKTSNPVWSDVLSGYFKKGGVQIDHEGHRKEVSEAALRDAMDKLAQSSSFRNAIQNYRPQ